MVNITPLIATANGGEWSPLLYGRIDLAKYQNSARRLINMIPLSQGPATHRPGTRHVAGTRNNAKARLVPFQFSTDQAYVIEATAGKFRFYKDRGQILDGAAAYERDTPYLEADLAQLKWCQSADVLYLWHPKYAPRKLSRTGHTAWTLEAWDPQDGPYLDVNTTSTTLTPSATSGNGITVTASSTTGINGGAGFKSTDVGRLIRIKNGSPAKWGWVKITAVGSATSVTADVKGTLGAATSATADWRLGAWSETTGWPSCGSFSEERLWAGGTRAQAQTKWASRSGDYENYSPSDPDGEVLADHAIYRTISDDRVNAIRWLSAGDVLSCGTSGGEYTVKASNLGEVLTPDNVTVRRSTTKGCADAMPVQVDSAVLYIQGKGRKLHEFAYNFESDGFRSPDLTLLAGHLTRPGLVEIAYQQEPWGILWAVRSDGLLLGLTYLREHDVMAWHRHPLGGCFNGGQAVVESITTIPGDGQDELWLSVKRTINGQTVRHVEVLEYEFWPEVDEDLKEAFFMDAGLTYRGAPVSHLTGLDHLEGEEVFYLADGELGEATVTGGAIDIANPSSVVHVGLYADAEYETMNLEYGTAAGTSVGRVKRVTEAAIRFWATLGAKVGPAGDDALLEEVGFQDWPLVLDALPSLFTGEKVVTFPANWEKQARVRIVQDRPLPITVVGIAPMITQQ